MITGIFLITVVILHGHSLRVVAKHLCKFSSLGLGHTLAPVSSLTFLMITSFLLFVYIQSLHIHFGVSLEMASKGVGQCSEKHVLSFRREKERSDLFQEDLRTGKNSRMVGD